MLTKRIIACLDVRGDRVVKGVQFEQLRDAGDPAELAKQHSQSGADEIVLLDISAATEGRATLLETVRRTARQIFIPFTVGGGIRTLEEAAAVFAAGADKISVNTAALADPALISPASASVSDPEPSSSRSMRNARLTMRTGASLHTWGPERHRTRCAGMGTGSGSAGRRRDSVDVHGQGWNRKRF